MKIANREVKILTTINYIDGCTKNIDYLKVYLENRKTPALNYKTVEFRHPDGKIDADRSYYCRRIIDDIDDSDTESDSDSDTESNSDTESDSESPNAK